MNVETAFRIIIRPYITEKTLNIIEKTNTLVFIVDGGARKEQIKRAVEILYDVRVDAINTAKTTQGKKAYVKLRPEYSASDLASRLGIL